MGKVSILIPDGENNYLQVILHCLSDVKGTRIFVLSGKKSASMRYSIYVHKYIYKKRTEDPADLIRNVNEVMEAHDIDVIIPLAEKVTRQFIALGASFPGHGKLLIPGSLKNFDISKNKVKLAGLLKKNGLPVPQYRILDNDAISAGKHRKYPYPVLLKPADDKGNGEGIIRFEDPQSLEAHFMDKCRGQQVFIQKFIDGYDLDCSVICRNGEVLALTMQKGNLYSKEAYTPQIGLDMIYVKDIHEDVSRLMRILNWSGVAHIDLRFDNDTGKNMFLEINPRFWMTMLGSHLAGVNFPWLYCLTVMGRDYERPEYRLNSFLHEKGLKARLRENPLFLLKLKYIWLHTPVRFMVRDPFMTLIHVAWVLKNRTKKLFRKKKQANPPEKALDHN